MTVQVCRPSTDPELLENPDPLDPSGWPFGVAYMVGRLNRAVRQRFRKVLEPMGLTVGQYTALSVFCSNGKLSNAKLAERIMVSPQAANELIKGMQKNGWIVRKPDPNHGRIIQVSLTKEGQKLLMQCNKQIAGIEVKILQGLSEKEVKTLHGQLRHAVSLLKEL
ncbi:MAG: MarR family transcriptional regulator [Candidatus Thiodiazotropha sp.]|jgi:DNA-binding MarR family transcriptional regulator